MTTWRVLTWNIHGAGRPNVDVIGEIIAGYAPDVVALQEVQHQQARRLARQLGWRALWTRKHHPYSPFVWWRTEGLALLTPHRFGDRVSASISPGVTTWTHRHRVVMAVTVSRDGDSLRVANVHLGTRDPDERIAQARRVIPVVGDRRPAVVAGDLNAADEVEVIREFGVLLLVDPGGDFTSPAITPRQRLDYVLVPDSATIIATVTPPGGEPWDDLSDHLPVLVAFEV